MTWQGSETGSVPGPSVQDGEHSNTCPPGPGGRGTCHQHQASLTSSQALLNKQQPSRRSRAPRKPRTSFSHIARPEVGSRFEGCQAKPSLLTPSSPSQRTITTLGIAEGTGESQLYSPSYGARRRQSQKATGSRESGRENTKTSVITHHP